MSRRFLSGFETGNEPGNEWSGGSLATFSIVTTPLSACGLRSGKFTGQGYIERIIPGIPTFAYARAVMKIMPGQTASANLITLRNAAGQNWATIWLEIPNLSLSYPGPSGAPLGDFLDNLSPVATTLVAGTAYTIELYVNVAANIIMAKLDGVLWAAANVEFTGVTGLIERLVIGPYHGNPGADIYFDDVALNDSQGFFNSSWCGSTSGIYLGTPSSDVHDAPNEIGPGGGWARSAGSDDWALVDDLPGAVDDDATYLKETAGTFGANTLVGMSVAPLHGAVSAVHIGFRFGGPGAADRTVGIQLMDDLWQVALAAIFGPPSTAHGAGYTSFYPQVYVDGRQWNGTLHQLTTHYLEACALQLVRYDATASEIRCTAMWWSVDIAIPQDPLVLPAGTVPRPRMLVDLNAP